MQQWLAGSVLLASAVAGILSELFLFRVGRPPDEVAAVLGGLWIAMPYLAAVGMAALFRRSTPALVALLIALLITSGVGLSMYHASAKQQEAAEQQLRDAVQPGEDPDHGPAAKRKTGAEVGVAIGWAFSILLLVVLPPVQLAAMFLPTLITYGVAVMVREPEPRQVEVGV
jgi:F0F1-type ATP synthase assembly protein I